MQTLGYFLRRVGRNLRQTPLLCSAAIGTVAVALTIMAFFAIVVLNVQQVTRQWSRELQVIVYLDRMPEASQLRQWRETIGRMPEVTDVNVVSPGEAFSRLRLQLGEDADLLEGMESDFLPASLEVVLRSDMRNKRGVATVVGRLRQNPAFQDVSYQPEWLDRFDGFVRLLKLGGFLVGGFLLLAALFIVANTIKLTLYARREEIEIMALAGGTPLFIKTPFLLEGMLQGALGGVLALGGSFVLQHMLLRHGLDGFLLTLGTGGMVYLSFAQQGLVVAGGVLLGLTGSLVSLRKFVRIG
jgi:cell division transport system permease protein